MDKSCWQFLQAFLAADCRESEMLSMLKRQTPTVELLDSVGPSLQSQQAATVRKKLVHVTCGRVVRPEGCHQKPAAISWLTKAFLSSFLLWAKYRRRPEFKDETRIGQNLGSQRKREKKGKHRIFDKQFDNWFEIIWPSTARFAWLKCSECVVMPHRRITTGQERPKRAAKP